MEVIKKIGSHPDNDIVIKSREVAAHHAELRMTVGRHCYLTDLDSPQGTSVNNMPLEGTRKLKPSDVVNFGDYNFIWEEHYPSFLDKSEPDQIMKPVEDEDSLLDTFDGTSITESTGDKVATDEWDQVEMPQGLNALQRTLFMLRNPRDRNKIGRIWMLVLSGIILVSIIFPQFSWYHENLAFRGWGRDNSEIFSGFQLLAELFDLDFEGMSMFETFANLMVTLLITLLTFFSIAFGLIGLNVWKPASYKPVRTLSLILIIVYGVVALNQLVQYFRIFFADTGGIFGSKAYNYISIENTGIGFWICMLASILIFKSTRNGLWQNAFRRKWVTLSFGFWIPVFLLLSFAHQQVGVMVQKVDVQSYKKQFGQNGTIGEIPSRQPQNGPIVISSTYYFNFNEWKGDTYKGNRHVTESELKIKSYLFSIWILLNLWMLLILLMLFVRRIFSNYYLILGLFFTLVSIGLFYECYGLIDSIEVGLGNYLTSHVGLVLYLSIAGGIGIVVEQLIQRRVKTKMG